MKTSVMVFHVSRIGAVHNERFLELQTQILRHDAVRQQQFAHGHAIDGFIVRRFDKAPMRRLHSLCKTNEQ